MQNRTLVYTKKELLYILTAVLLVFQIYLQPRIKAMQYFDELVTLACLAKIFVHCLRGRLEKTHALMLALMVTAACIGIMSNLYAGVQTGIKPIVTDIGNSFKVFVVYIGSSLYLKTVRDKRRIVSALAAVMRIFVCVLFVCMLLHEAGMVSMGRDRRYGLQSFQFLNDGAGQLSMLFYGVVLILTLDLKQHARKPGGRLLFVGMALMVWISTLRSRAFTYVIIYLFLYRMLIVKEKRLVLNWKYGFFLLAVLLYFGIDQIKAYFFTLTTARSNLLRYGIYTMCRFFPFGAGFGTFGTDAAAKYYSALYVEYGFPYIHGLSKGNMLFAHDTYWPAVCAQLGFFGALFMAFVVLLWCKDLLRRTKGNKYDYFLALFICITQVSSSAATATFFHFVTVGLMFLLPLLHSREEKKEKRNDTLNGIHANLQSG